MKTQTDIRLSDDEMMTIAAKGARVLDERELESALRHSLRSPLKKYKLGHFTNLASPKASMPQRGKRN
jgi:Arc/MetJ family transcription regulator